MKPRATVTETPDAPPRHRRRGRHLPSMSVLPTLCTLGNLVAGFAAILYASKAPESGLTMAGVLIFVGMVLDAVDGWIARLMRSISELGGQLDSLADVVTFGVAPAYIMLQLVNRHVADDTTSIASICLYDSTSTRICP